MKTTILAFLTTMVLCPAAHGLPVRFIADTCSEVCARDEGSLGAQAEVVGSNTTGYLYGWTSWEVRASAYAGTLRGYAYAKSDAFPNIPAGQVPPAVSGIVYAFAEDPISFSLAPMPIAQIVPLTFDLELGGTCSGTGGTNIDGTLRSECYVRAAIFFGGQEVVTLYGPGSASATRDLEFQPTDPTGPFELAYLLDLQGSATDGEFTGNFWNTARISVHTSAPGVSLTSASGYDYATPVPAPAAGWLLSTGGAVLVGRQWRRRRC